MCGLTGIAIGKKYNGLELTKIKELFTDTLLAHEERGKEATGAAIIWPSGNYEILKKPMRAAEFIKSLDYKILMQKWDKNVCTVLGHTRKPTKGSIWNEHNNHPVVVGDVIGIHNGTIKNDDILFKDERLARKAEVDSEVIFSILNKMKGDQGHHRFISEIQNCTKKLSGSFTTISTNLKKPQKLLLLKYNQPLSYHYSKTLKTLFFTSRYIFLRKAFGRAVVTEALPSKMAYIFDLYTNSKEEGRPIRQFPITCFEDEV